MEIRQDVDLAGYSTMRLGGKAKYLVHVNHEEQLPEIVAWAGRKKIPFITIGGGSNIIWRDEGFDGIVIVNRLLGRDVIAEDDDSLTVRVAAGENWDKIVSWAVSKKISGIECLSLIPGSTGATPIQNVEAYGQAISDTLVEVEVYDTKEQAFGGILNEACDFGYRTSRFKTTDKGRFIVTAIVLKLRKSQISPPFHGGLQPYVEQTHMTDFSPASIRQAIIEIRSAKLPDPAIVANNGSFFTNPLVTKDQFEALVSKYPDLVYYPAKEGKIKLSARWLIENSGFRAGHQDPQTGMALWPNQALVVVNEHADSTADLLTFKKKIVDVVRENFGITLQQEPELLP